MERQPQVNSLQEISNSLLIKGHGEDYIEAEEKVHVIEKKLKQLLEQVSQDLMSLQGHQVSPLVVFNYKDVTFDANRKAEGGREQVEWSEWSLESCPLWLRGLKKSHKLFEAVCPL